MALIVSVTFTYPWYHLPFEITKCIPPQVVDAKD